MNNKDLFGYEQLITVEKSTNQSGLEAMADAAYHHYCIKKPMMMRRIREAGLPAPGQQLRLVTRRSFNAIEVLQFICESEKILDLKITIYSMNFEAAAALVMMIDLNKIVRLEILMSNLRNAAHREKEELIKKLFVDHPRITIFYCSSHAKSFAAKTSAGNHYVLWGSGNFGYNSRVEQYTIDNDLALYEFECQWMNDIKEFLKGKSELQIPEQAGESK